LRPTRRGRWSDHGLPGAKTPIARSTLLEGKPLRAQLVTVPGQIVHTQRRWEILRGADAVVAVCDAAPSALPRARVGWRVLEVLLRLEGAPVPVIIQANKQDLPGALGPEELRTRLGAAADVPCMPASALDGTGVRSTLLAAIHTGADRLRNTIVAAGGELGPAVEGAEPSALYARLLALEESHEMDQAARIADAILKGEGL